MVGGPNRAKKEAYSERFQELLEEYPTIFIVNVDNVGSSQMHEIRKSLRGTAVILMGKNTMMRRVLRTLREVNPAYEKLVGVVKGNIGLVFTKGDLKETRAKILANRVQAPAKAGAIAPLDVVIPAGNTGMEPGKTSFFQALGIPTKIARGTIEIVADVSIIKTGNKVGASEATLLNMLNISPFTYGLSVVSVYDDGAVFAPELIDIDNDTLLKAFVDGISEITRLSLELHYPTVSSVPHLVRRGFMNLVHLSLSSGFTIKATEELANAVYQATLLQGFKNLLAVALETGYSFPLAEAVKGAMAAGPVVSAAPAAAAAAAPAAAAAKVEEEEEEEEGDSGYCEMGGIGSATRKPWETVRPTWVARHLLTIFSSFCSGLRSLRLNGSGWRLKRDSILCTVDGIGSPLGRNLLPLRGALVLLDKIVHNSICDLFANRRVIGS